MINLLKSIAKSISQGIKNDPEIKKLAMRYPRFFGFIKKRLTPDSKLGLHLTIGAIFTLIFIYLFFGILDSVIGQGSLIQSDLRIINLLQILRTPSFNDAMLFITYLGKWQIVAFGAMVIAIIFALLKRWRHLIALIFSVVGGELFVWFIKNIIERPRPLLVNALTPETSFSFPSGHSFVAVSFYGLLGYFIFRTTKNKLLKILSVLLVMLIILAIGFSRIYLGVHWPSDVLASYASAAAWLTALITALEIRKKFNPREYNAPYISHSSIIAAGIILFALWGFYIGYFFQNHPLKPRQALADNQAIVSEKDIPQNLFLNLPKRSEDITGKAMEPINIIAIGSYENLIKAFGRAGWILTDQISVKSAWHIATASILNKPYPKAPGTPSFWNTRANDFAFEQPTAADTVRERHHLHFWKTPFATNAGENIWFGTAHFDKAIKLGPSFFIPVHTIDPAVDKERDKIKDDLLKTDSIKRLQEFQIVEPMLGSNQAGDQFFTDGKSYVIFLKK
jgi:undecaprenyl-diphosphatase